MVQSMTVRCTKVHPPPLLVMLHQTWSGTPLASIQ
jgi:hypothetical protein